MELISGFFFLFLLLWGTYSIVGIIYPFRPFGTRLRALKSFGMTIAVILATSLTLGIYLENTEETKVAGTNSIVPASPETEVVQDVSTPLDDAVIESGVVSTNDIPDPCGNSGLALMDIVAVSGEYEPRTLPTVTAGRIVNVKASQSLGVEHFHRIDNSVSVRRLCVQPEWTEIQIISPDWLTHVRGWVPNNYLRLIENTAGGIHVFVEEDFYWDSDTSKFKTNIVSIVNRIFRENTACTEIDTSSVAKSATRSTSGDPVFFVTCNLGTSAFNVWFRPSDTPSSVTFTRIEPLAKNAAVAACEAYSKSVATHPSTVRFSHIWDMAYMQYPSGRARVVSSFSAENAFGIELKYRIDCLFDGLNLLEVSIVEANG